MYDRSPFLDALVGLSACGVVHAVSCMLTLSLTIKGFVRWDERYFQIWPCGKFDLPCRSSQEVNFDRDVQQWTEAVDIGGTRWDM